MSNKNLTGKYVEKETRRAGITTNKIWFHLIKKVHLLPAAIRIGTPALTTRGMKETEMNLISIMIDKAIRNIDDDAILDKIAIEVKELTSNFPLHKECEHEML